MHIIMNLEHEKPIDRLKEKVIIGGATVDGVSREYYIDNGLLCVDNDDKVMTYELYYEHDGGYFVSTHRAYRNLTTAIADAAVYVDNLAKGEEE